MVQTVGASLQHNSKIAEMPSLCGLYGRIVGETRRI